MDLQLLKKLPRYALLGLVLALLTGNRGEDFPFMCSSGVGLESPRLAVTKSPLSVTGFVAEHGPLFESVTIPVAVDDLSSTDFIKVEGEVAALPGSLSKQKLTAYIAKSEAGASYVKLSRSMFSVDNNDGDAPDDSFQEMTCWKQHQEQ